MPDDNGEPKVIPVAPDGPGSSPIVAPTEPAGPSRTWYTLEVETMNIVLDLIDREMNLYKPGTPEALALWKFREKLEQ